MKAAIVSGDSEGLAGFLYFTVLGYEQAVIRDQGADAEHFYPIHYADLALIGNLVGFRKRGHDGASVGTLLGRQGGSGQLVQQTCQK